MRNTQVEDARGGGVRERGGSVTVRLVAALLAIVAITVARADDLEVHGAREPVLLALEIGPIGPALGADDAGRQALAARLGAQIAAAEASHPGRLLTLWIDHEFAFLALAGADRDEIARSVPGDADPADWYERGLATLLRRAIGHARALRPDLRSTVLGLPLEPTRAMSPAQTADANGRYATLVDEVDAIVTRRTIILSGAGRDEGAAVRQVMADALAIADGRPLFYRANGDWRMAQDVSRRHRGETGTDETLYGTMPTAQLVWYEDFETDAYERWSSSDYDSGWSDCTTNRFADNRFVSAGHSHKSRIRCADSGGLHRGYGLLRFEGDTLVPSLSTSSSGGIDSPDGVVVSFWSWLKASRAFGDGSWISLLTVTDDCSNAWNGVVTLGIQDATNRLAPAHVDSWQWVPDAPSFPLRQWVRTTVYLNYYDGVMHVWQDGQKVCEAAFERPGTDLCQWHFGLYASGDNDDIVLYEDDMRITRLLEPLTDLQAEPLFGPGPAGPQDGSDAGGGNDDGGGNEGGDPPPTTSALARFDDPPDPYLLGSGRSVGLELLEDAPPQPSVVFQVWSEQTQSVLAAHPDYQPPFVYPAAVLDQLPPGDGKVQAIVRNATNQPVGMVERDITFVLAPDPWQEERTEDDLAPRRTAKADRTGDETTGGTGGAPPPDGDVTPPPSDGGDLTPPAGDGSGVAIAVANATTGVTPLAVHAHALQSEIDVGDILTTRFEWSFGDESAPYDRLEGFNAAHVYDEPGTYTITLTVTDERGESTVTTVPIEVAASQRRLVHVAPSGQDINDGATPTTAVRSLVRAMQLLDDGTAILLRRGAAFPVASPIHIDDKDVVIGAYGSGDRPVLQWTGPAEGFASVIELTAAARNVVLEDLSLVGTPTVPTNATIRGIAAKGRAVTIRRCRFSGLSTAIMAEAGGVNDLLTVDNEAEVLGAYFVWGEGRDHVHLGNVVGGSLEQHNMRFVADRVLVAHNTLTNAGKSAIWLQQGRHGWIAENIVHEGPVQVGPIPQVGAPGARWRWAVIESNRIDNDAYKVFHGAKHVMLRNNVCDWDGGRAFDIMGHSDQMQRTAVDVRVVHNTAINRSTAGKFLVAGAGVVDVTVANNMYVAPALETGTHGTANMYVADHGLDGFSLICGNLWAEPAVIGWGDGWHYCWPSWADPSGYLDAQQWAATGKPQEEAYRRFQLEDLDGGFRPQFDAGGAPAVPGVHTDLYGAARPLSGTVIAGAVQ